MSGKRRHGRGGHGDGGHGGEERWLITYADLITLLAAFFIMMYSLGQLDLVKFNSLVKGYRQSPGTLGIMAGGTGPLGGGDGVLEGGRGADAALPDDARGGGDKPATTLDAGLKQLQKYIESAGLAGQAEVRMTSEGLVVSLATPLLFDSGSADLRAEAEPILEAIGRVIAQMGQPMVRVEGHTDNIPISSARFPSNWELSSARAATVVRHFLTASGLSGTRLTVVGYGEFRPVASNGTPEGRARNRRVEIIVLKPHPK